MPSLMKFLSIDRPELQLGIISTLGLDQCNSDTLEISLQVEHDGGNKSELCRLANNVVFVNLVFITTLELGLS